MKRNHYFIQSRFSKMKPILPNPNKISIFPSSTRIEALKTPNVKLMFIKIHLNLKIKIYLRHVAFWQD